MITGGSDGRNSVEIIDTKDGNITMASPMNIGRAGHGMDVVTINGEDKLVVFGGVDESASVTGTDVELYNTETEKWEASSLKMKKGKSDFAYLSLKLSDIDSKLRILP